MPRCGAEFNEKWHSLLGDGAELSYGSVNDPLFISPLCAPQGGERFCHPLQGRAVLFCASGSAQPGSNTRFWEDVFKGGGGRIEGRVHLAARITRHSSLETQRRVGLSAPAGRLAEPIQK
jgi:hypothetical protein